MPKSHLLANVCRMFYHDYSHWVRPVFHYPDMASFLASRVFASGIHAIVLPGGRVLDILVEDRAQKQALICFHAAVDRTKTPLLPFFSGVNISGGLPATLIAVSDPSLDDDPTLGLAWYAGSLKAPLQKLLPPILDHLLRMLGCARSVAFGSSGGGYAALLYARTLPDCLPIAVNPQTRISAYFPQFVEAFARACYAWDGAHPLPAFLHGRLVERVSALYRVGNTPFLILQNESDPGFKAHVTQFVADLGGPRKPMTCLAGSGRVIVHEWGQGHAPLPKNELVKILWRAFDHEGLWARFVEDTISL